MKNLLIVLGVVGSILGLVLVQYHFLKVGLLLEKRKFDWKVERSLELLAAKVEETPMLRGEILELHPVTTKDSADRRQPSSKQKIIDTLSSSLEGILQRQDLKLKYDFAITTGAPQEILVASENYYQDAFVFERYRRQLKGKLAQACECDLYLHFQVDHLFNYLLGQLAYLIIPSILAILLLIICLLLLIRNLNRQRKLDRVKNDFINNLTHELKTPVFSISLLGKVLRESVRDGKTDKSMEYLDLLEKENHLMKGHIEKVLELASLESGRYELNRESIDMHALLTDLAGHYTVKVRERKGQITQQLDAVRKDLWADIQHLRNAIQNLIENAIKYNEQEPRITINTRNETNHFILSIQDNGIGIPAEEQRRIFDKFYRVSTGNVHQVKGFGLGLSYVKQIVEAHGGAISVDSKPGEGSKFSIVLPFDKD